MSVSARKLRYAIIGVAGVGQHHCRFAHCHDDVEVVALVDPNQQAIDDVIKANNWNEQSITCYQSHAQMLDCLSDCSIDAVSICVPHAFLYDIAKDCLEQGLHALVEKPFSIRLSQANHLVSLANEKKRTLAVAYQYRTFNTPRRLKKLIDSKLLGNLTRVLWTWFEFRPQSYYSRDAWRAKWSNAGGGLLMNQISHELDLVRWLFGEPEEVSATLANQFGRSELEDIASISLTFADGMIATLQASLNQPHGYTVKQVVGEQGAAFINQSGRSATNPNDEIELYSFSPLRQSAQHLEDDHAQPMSDEVGNAQRRAVGLPAKRSRFKTAVSAVPGMQKLVGFFHRARGSYDRRPASGHGKLMDDFVDSIFNQSTPLVSGEDAAKTLQLINAIIMSAVQKRSIGLPLNSEDYDLVFERLVSGDEKIRAVRGQDKHEF